MTVRPYSEATDYETIASWAVARGIPAPPVAMLPRHGFVAKEDGKLMGAVWLYMDTSSRVGFPHWLSTCLGLDRIKARQVIGGLLGELQETAKRERLHTLVGHTNEDGVTKEAVDHFGWKIIGFGATLFKEP